MKALKMAVVFGECGRECLSGPGNTDPIPKTHGDQIFYEKKTRTTKCVIIFIIVVIIYKHYCIAWNWRK